MLCMQIRQSKKSKDANNTVGLIDGVFKEEGRDFNEGRGWLIKEASYHLKTV